MKILHVYRTYFPDTQGGLEEAIRQICISTGKFGATSRVFTLSRRPGAAHVALPEADVFRAPLSFELASCGVSLRGLAQFREQLRWADVVHYHFPWPFADLLYLLAGFRKPSILTYHSDIVRQQGLLKLYRPLMRTFLAKVDRIIATSPNYLASSEVLQSVREKVEVIPLGINEDSYPLEESLLIPRSQNQHYFFFIGVHRYYKGLHTLLEAAAGADYSIVIAGTGPREAELRSLADDRRLDNVHFLGQVSDAEKLALIRDSIGIVFPSLFRSEAFGITLVEGLMMGKPLISCEIGTGTSYVNKNGETGYVVSPGNPRELRDAMDRMFLQTNDVARMGLLARKRFESMFAGEALGRDYISCYRELAS